MREVLMPTTLNRLWEFLEESPQTAIYAGGTDLLVALRRGSVQADRLICLERMAELKGIQVFDEAVRIGACTTHQELLSHPVMVRRFPLLTKALGVLGSPPIRHMGTIGGNICTASPAGDTLPALYLFQGEVEVTSDRQTRRMPIRDFIQGPGMTALRPKEVVTAIRLPKAPEFNIQHFEKVGQRKALAISVISLAALVSLSREGVVEDARLAWGSVGPTVVTSPEVADALRGRPLDVESLKNAAPLAEKAVKPRDDLRASARYRRTLAGNLLLRLAIPGKINGSEKRERKQNGNRTA